MQRGVLWIITFLCFAMAPALAQAPVAIDDNRDEQDFLLKQMEYLIDSTARLTIHEISDPDYTPFFKKHDNYQNKDFRINASYWLRIPIHLNPRSEKKWLIEFYDQTIDHLEAYIPQADGTFRKIAMGDRYPFDHRTFQHKNFEIPVEMTADTTVTYYFNVRSHDFADIRLSIRSIDRFIYYTLNEYLLYGTFYGMILIISLYNFLVYLAIREIKNVFYICYMASVALYTLSLDGIGFQYLWPAHPELNDYFSGVWLYSIILWALIFTRRFLSTKANAPELDKMLQGMIIARSILFVIELFFFPQFFAFRSIEIIPLSLIFFTGIWTWYGGYRPARFFVIAYGVLFIGFFIRGLVYFNVLPFTTLSHYSLHISFVLEMLFLTFALGDRIRILKDMRDRALRRIIHQHEVNMQLKDKVNRELEQKVQERTEELNSKNHQLEESNHKLARQAQEINQINSILDLDNWKLKNRIKEVLTDRLMERIMDYGQFKTLYPDQLACYRFLETLKWEHGFQCRKCSNEKHFDGAQKFARRCTRCGYNESITAFTIFHSIKFPIEKAFYIAYLAVTGRKDTTLETLATQLDLRVNTVWNFRHKVADRIHELEKTGRRPVVSRWEEVILLADGHKSGRTKKSWVMAGSQN